MQDHQGKSGNASKDPSSDYQEGATHVFSVIHDILAQHRALEAKWHAKKIKLHQRLALRLFQEDVKQVSRSRNVYWTSHMTYSTNIKKI